jgi:uncharacterized membrane protein YhhN
MKKHCLWPIAGIFFLVFSLLDFAGCIWAEGLHHAVKPALLPLLSLTSILYLLENSLCRYNPDTDSYILPEGGLVSVADRREIGLLVGAQLLGCAGDVLLLGEGFPLFAGGIGAFLLGHVCYMCLFGKFSWDGLNWKQWCLAFLGMAALVVILIVSIGVKGTLLPPMAIYAFALAMLIFSGLAGVLRIGGATWWIILCGGIIFTFSDSLIAMENFGKANFALRGFTVMATYLLAQTLLAIGAIRLILDRR